MSIENATFYDAIVLAGFIVAAESENTVLASCCSCLHRVPVDVAALCAAQSKPGSSPTTERSVSADLAVHGSV